MKLSQHATRRCQQRAIPPLAVELVMRFGQREKAPGGVEKVFLTKTARRKLLSYAGPLGGALEQHLDIYLVLGDDDRVVTAAHRLERIQRH